VPVRLGTGALKREYDPFDCGFAALGLGARGDADLDSDLVPFVKLVRDQGPTPTCGGQAFAGSIDVATSQSVHRADYREPASALFIYNLAIRRAYGAPVPGVGIDSRSCAKVLQKHGTCDERLWPFDDEKVLDSPSWDAIFGGSARAGCSYAFVGADGQQRIGELSAAMHAGRVAPVVGLDLPRSFQTYTSGTIEQPDGVVWARHFVLLVGRDRVGGRFRFLNSWNISWGEDGFGWLSDEYVAGQWCWDPCLVYGFDRARER
jgi:hypothetical protein